MSIYVASSDQSDKTCCVRDGQSEVVGLTRDKGKGGGGDRGAVGRGSWTVGGCGKWEGLVGGDLFTVPC